MDIIEICDDEDVQTKDCDGKKDEDSAQIYKDDDEVQVVDIYSIKNVHWEKCSCFTANIRAQKRIAKLQRRIGSLAEAPSKQKVRIVDFRAPEGKIAEDIAALIEENLQEFNLLNQEVNGLPRFSKFVRIDEHLEIECVDSAARRDLAKCVAKIKPPCEDCMLNVVHFQYYNRKAKRIQMLCNYWLPDHLTFMRILSIQNKELNARHWYPDYTDDDIDLAGLNIHGTLRTYYVDDESYYELLQVFGWVSFEGVPLMFHLSPNEIFIE